MKPAEIRKVPGIAALLLLLLLAGARGYAQDRMNRIAARLDSLSQYVPGLNDRSDLALSNVPLHDYVRALGKVHQINVYIDDIPNATITNNFVNEPVKSIFMFICKKFSLNIEVTGTILNFVPWKEPVAAPPPAKPRDPQITFAEGKLSFDLQNDTLAQVMRKVSRLTGETIILSPGAEGLLSGFIPANEPQAALENILFANGFAVTRNRKGIYIVEKTGAAAPAGGKPAAGSKPMNPGSSPAAPGGYTLQVGRDTAGTDLIFLDAEATPLDRIIRDLFQQLGLEYYLFDQLEGSATLHVEGATLDEVLRNALRGTDFTWRNDNGVYLLGKREMEGLRQVRIVHLHYRPSAKVIELIPAQLKENVELKEFVELNRIILSGSSESLTEIERFIQEIDRPVPMVKIEMVVVDVDFSRLMKTGIRAGLMQPGDSVSAVKSLFPGLEYNLDGSTINDILQNSGIPSLTAVGALRSNFYLQLQAQESRGNLRVVTRPVLSTLNGNEASIVIGQTDYYLLETNTASNGAVNSFNQVSQRYERIEINTTIKIKPLVSQDGMVTLELSPDFTAPGTRVDPKIPPSILRRSFQSTIRVKDGETVVLGGLSREANSAGTEGLPWVSRVPVLKWIFGTNTRSRSKSSLIVYITPTIYYN